MSPLTLLALAIALVTFGGGAVVYLYDLLEARFRRTDTADNGGRNSRRTRAMTFGRQLPPARGVIVTVRAGSAGTGPLGRGERDTAGPVAVR